MLLRQMGYSLYSLPPILTALLLAAMAGAAVLSRRRARVDCIFAVMCLLGSLLYVDMLINFNASSARVALFTSRVGHIFHPFLLPLFIHFFHAFLGIAERQWLVRLAYGYAAVVALCVFGGDWVIADVRRFAFGYFGQGGPLFFLMGVGAAFATSYNVTILIKAIGSESRSIYKNKLWYLFIGFGVLGALSTLNCLTLFGWPIYPPGAFGFVPLLFFAAGFFRYDLLDVGLLMRKGVVYILLMLAGVIVSLAAVKLMQSSFQGVVYGTVCLSIFAILLFAVSVSEKPLSLLQRFFNRFWGGDFYDHQMTLERVSQTIATVLDREKITRLMQETIVDAMRVKHCALFLADSASGIYRAIASAGEAAGGRYDAAMVDEARLVGALQGRVQPILKQKVLGAVGDGDSKGLLSEMAWLQAEVVFPMCFKAQLKGFLVMGEKLSGRIYSTRDIDLLVPLCHQSAVAIQNAQAYQALRELNDTLEAQVAERTKELEAALEEKERSQEHLIRSESLAALGQLVAGVAHEMNNPLASVTSLLQSISEELSEWDTGQPLDEGLLDDLHFAGKELARAKSIVASLLGLSRQTQTYEESVDMNLVVRDALRVLQNQYKHGTLSVVEDLIPGLPMLRGNFANLGQVVLNIIRNAIQAVEDRNGEVSLSTSYEVEAGQVVFRCRDNGSGIAPVDRQNVFKPFFTTKPVGQGTGLGLYICHQIVQRHRGGIDLETSQPNGTQVTVRLPAGPGDGLTIPRC